MADDVKLYAQFDGDEIDGKRYSLGEEVKNLDAGTRDYLVSIGRVSAAKPADASIAVEAMVQADKADDTRTTRAKRDS